MKIQNVRHKGLRRLIEDDNAAGVPAACVPKILDIVAYLIVIDKEDELHDLKLLKAHLMIGDRAGTWALHVTKNWRITFWIDRQVIEIIDLDFEDYH